ncbi:MAG: NYN domain-containing protein [Eubacterium sp.]|nr:NYN domain-containing protein [Eubacterium sp.]
MEDERKIAVLIDAENVSKKYITNILEEVSNYGEATYKRIYGDWTKGNGWKDILLENSLIPIQQYSYTQGKNATDSAMIIDAMDILYSGNVSGFCIVSSDSDFTRLAARLRESGSYVIGMGEKKTPNAFRKACNVFKILEYISGEKEQSYEVDEKGGVTPAALIRDSVYKILMENANKGKETQIGEIGSKLNMLYPDFDIRNYGFSKLSTFLAKTCKDVALTNKMGQMVLSINEHVDDIEKTIVQIIIDNGGEIDNLSVLNKELTNEYPGFNVRNYGYAKFSSFVKSLPSVKVHENSVKLR